MSLFEELKRRKVFKVGVGYLVVAWLVVQVASIGFPAFDAPPWALRVFILVLLLGFPISLLFAWAFDVTPEGIKADPAERGNKRFVLVTVVLIALAFAWYFKGQPSYRESTAPAAGAAQAKPTAAGTAAKPAARSIAVLPFVNMSADKENEFFSDGLSEEILNSLARIDGLQVVGRTSSFQFKGRSDDLRAIGEKLGVATVLEGSVRREGEHARITAQLIRASDGIHLWSQTYDRTVKDTLAVQLDIAEQVAGALNVLLDDAQRARMRQARVANVDAFVAYQKGLKLFEQAHSDPQRDLLAGLRLANAEFDRATTLEPDFSEAHFMKADLYEHSLQDEKLGQAERLQAQRAALQTLELAADTSTDEQQHRIFLAERQMLSDDWHGLGALIQSALTAPGCNSSNWLPVFASAFGYGEEIEDFGKRASACDPLNRINYSTRITAALASGKGQRALDVLAQARKSLGQVGPSTGPSAARAYMLLGQPDEADRALEAMPVEDRAEGWYSTRFQLGRVRGEAPAATRAALAGFDRSNSKYGQWQVAEGIVASVSGDRVAANRIAASLDARPAGAFLLALYVDSCACGAPFDIEATPRFKARLAESGMRWPPPATIAFPPRQ